MSEKQKKEPEHICNTCLLFNRQAGSCKLVLLVAGMDDTDKSKTSRVNIPVDPGDLCFFEQEIKSKRPMMVNGKIYLKEENFIPSEEIKQVNFWVEDPKTGEKKDGNGVVKIEYPTDFFGPSSA